MRKTTMATYKEKKANTNVKMEKMLLVVRYLEC